MVTAATLVNVVLLAVRKSGAGSCSMYFSETWAEF